MSLIKLDTSAPLIVQHRSDTGFNGSELGRALLNLNNVRYRARYLGTDGNALTVTIRVIAAFSQIVIKVESTGITVMVPSGTTNAQLATAINANLLSPVVAHVISAGAVTAGSGTLSGAIDPTVVDNVYYRFTPGAGVQGGLFFHYASRNQYVTQIEGNFTLGGATTVTIDVITLNEGFEPITDEYGTIFSQSLSAVPSFCVTDVRVQLLPYRAIRVVIAAPGTIRFQLQQAAVQTAV